MQKNIIKDLNYCFDRYFTMGSTHILLVGDLTYKKLTEDGALDFMDDRSKCLKKLYSVLQHCEMLKFIDMQKDLKKKTEEAQTFLNYYCTSTSSEKLGFADTRYKASEKTKLLLKTRNEYYKLLGLKCIHSTDDIAKNY